MTMAAAEPLAGNYREAPDNRALDHVPGDDGWPLLGRAIEVARDMRAMCEDQLRRFGPISRLRLMDQRGLLVIGADLYQRILLDREGQFSAEKGYEGALGRFYQGGLLLTDFDVHRASRRLMQGGFKPAALDRHLAMMQPLIDAQLQRWGEQPGFVFYPHVKQLLLEIGARCFLGIDDLQAEGQLVSELFLDLNAGLVTLLPVELPIGVYGRAARARRRLEAWFGQQVARRRADPEGAGGGDDVLSHMCRELDESGQPFSVTMIVNHVIFLLFAAHDTNASALTHLAMYLGRDAALQQRLREELAPLAEPLTRATLAPLSLAEHCFHEVMRLHPPVPMMVRRTIVDMELEGIPVPAHTILFMPTVMNHIDPRWWSEPDRFDPERFAPERAEQRRHPLCYHPFGSGAHKCIGMHFADLVVKTVLQRLLTRYTLQTPPGYAPRLDWVPLPKPADGVPLTLTRR